VLHYFIQGKGEGRESVAPGQVVEGDHFAQFVQEGLLYEVFSLPEPKPVVAEKPQVKYNPVVGVADKMAAGMAAFVSKPVFTLPESKSVIVDMPVAEVVADEQPKRVKKGKKGRYA